jgi:hypothetical protein
VLLTLAAEAHKTSKTAFYVAAGLLVLWAILVSVMGINRPDFPGGEAGGRLVMLLSAVLVAAAMTTAVVTS